MHIPRLTPLTAMVVAVLLGPVSAAAAPLAAAKASQLVTLTGSANSTGNCGGFPTFRFLDNRLTSDGTTTAFAIPEKKVLVLKRGEASVTVPADGADFGLTVTSGNLLGQSLVDVRIDGNGLARGKASFDFGDGVVVRPGHKVCFGAIGLSGSASVTFIRVHGFLAADN